MRLRIRNKSRISDDKIIPLVKYASEFFNFTGKTVVEVRRTHAHFSYGNAGWRSAVLYVNDKELAEPIKVERLCYFRNHNIPVNPYELHDWEEALVHLAAHEMAHMTIPGRMWRKSRREVYCENRATKVLEAYRIDGRSKVEAARQAMQSRPEKKDEHIPERKLLKIKDLLSKWERKAKFAKTRIATLKRKAKYYEKKTQLSCNPA